MSRKKTAAAEGTSPSEAANGPERMAPPAPRPPAVSASQSPPAAGNGEQRQPVLKVGPIPTDKSSAVACAVWESSFTLADGRVFPIHTVSFQALSKDDSGQWKPQAGFRGSQLYVLLYCLQRCSDFILAQRDPANDCPF